MFRYPIPAAQARAEIVILKSRFIGIIDFADTVEAAQAFIRQVRAEFADASHVCHAFSVGFGTSTTQGCSDDGEPKGTAGRPMLAVLSGSGLGDVVATVVRYYGGTNLGTGGLVHAYGDAIKAALEALPRVEKVEKRRVMIALPYSRYERIKLLVAAHRGEIISDDFAADITLELEFVLDDVAPFNAALREMTAGQIEVIAL
ncbi:MAG: YigZ family protein [Anaerolineae bacterium]|nr:YigZ family protein [Anaerolineae bacterium]